MQQNILLSPISLDELENRLFARFKTELLSTAPQTAKQTEDEFLTAKQVSKLLGVSLVSLHKWKKDGKLKFHRFGTRIRFKRSEILNVSKFGGNK
jgi:excisionase family DNA binding protein